MNDLIIVKQLPIIEENLKKLSEKIKEKVENANVLVCTEETVKEVKKLRADLMKEFKELEEQRKTVKNQVMEPYMNFEELYKEYVSVPYKEADSTLKNKIDEVEKRLYIEKEADLIDFFNEQKLDKHIDFINFYQMNLNITLSSSMKSLKTQIKDFINKVEAEMETISLQENKEEILVEYMQHLDLNKAIKDVNDRHIALKQIEKNEEKREEVKIQEEQVIAKVEEIMGIPEEKKFKITFTVTGTKKELSNLKKYLDREGYKYDC